MEQLWQPKPQQPMQSPVWQAFQQRSFAPIKNAFSVKNIGRALTNQSNEPMSFMGGGMAGTVRSKVVPLSEEYLAKAAQQGRRRIADEWMKGQQRELQRINAREALIRAYDATKQRSQQAFNRAHEGFDITKLFK